MTGGPPNFLCCLLIVIETVLVKGSPNSSADLSEEVLGAEQVRMYLSSIMCLVTSEICHRDHSRSRYGCITLEN